MGRGALRGPPLPAMTALAQLLNFALSLVFWMILGRVMLTLITGGRDNFFLGVMRKGTDPVYAVVRALTGGRLGEGVVTALALVLVIVLRIALLPLMRE